MISVLFVLMGLASSALSLGCPPDESIFPCTCKEDDDLDVDVTLTCFEKNTTQEDIQRVLRYFDKQNTMAIELSFLKLGIIPSGFFQSVNVKRLGIWHSELESLAEEGGKPLTGLENSLEELIIDSSITDDDANFKLELSHLKQLRYLLLEYNTIHELGDDWFKNGPASLKQITLSNNDINKLGHRAFADLANIELFYMSGNRFGPIRRSMFPNPANKLVNLELGNNALTSLPEDMFSAMPSLDIVNLPNNGLWQIPKEIFATVWEQLGSLDLSENPLECDSHLEWIFHVKSPRLIFGTCQAPPEKDGVGLYDLIRGKLKL